MAAETASITSTGTTSLRRLFSFGFRPSDARTSTDTDKPRFDRSQSRGRDREPLVSSGRGGAGNIRPSSTSRDARPLDGPDDFSVTRGRELPTSHTVTHSGRGGAGNVRSPSRDPESERRVLAAEHERIVERLREEEHLPHSSGRGGAGNIARSRSRDGPARTLVGTGTGTTTHPSTHPHAQHEHVPNTGRGGYGNIVHAGPVAGYDLEAERAALHAKKAPLASSGTGLDGAPGIATREEKVAKLS
ncbi:hypothetical protein EXIGLDRAFT_847474 [Exidia glandulosa HHB12029]|uniref:Uncharacterized protein n=1 Tax=Exidia glandulosa HHB12029 TaxID=1314781 RepID=A0A166MWV0_EXIGL|nr:hypothetical protein EXIGLDRAFT_847474 [Exidia glandulosa HHB12029]